MTPVPAPVPRVVLDGRVTGADGRPVRYRQAACDGGWWFRIRRSPGPHGVELVTRIPGYEEHVTGLATEADADAAAVAIYAAYRAEVESVLGGSAPAAEAS